MELTTRERMRMVYNHQSPDRVPIFDSPWQSTFYRWKQEGLPQNIDHSNLVDYFGFDKLAFFEGYIDSSFRFKEEIIEETERYYIKKTCWGGTLKHFKPISSTPQYIDFTITNPDKWLKIKETMTATTDRINWKLLERDFAKWRKEGYWIVAVPLFGFEIVSTEIIGFERTLFALADEPEWVKEMLDHLCDLNLALLQMMWDKGYTFDEMMWYDDMSYKNGMLFSKNVWEELIKPYTNRAIEWAHNHGVKVQLHSCGNINAIVPELVKLEIDCLNPLEIRAGMNPIALKREFGKKLAFRGGSDVGIWDDLNKFENHMRTFLPSMMESGGYIFSSDHTVPDNISLENFKKIIEIVKKYGKY